MDAPVVIDVDRLTRTFGTFVAVDRLTFQVRRGETRNLALGVFNPLRRFLVA